MKTPTEEQLLAALSQAGQAHHDYERNALQGVRDEYWAGWYAAYVLGRLGDFMTPTLLTELLSQATGGDDWLQSAARYVADQVQK